MKLQFTTAVAAPTWHYPVGAVIDVDHLTPELERWIARGYVTVLRDPSAFETPEASVPPLERASVPLIPRLCPQGTAICLGGGPSLTAADVEACRGQGTVIAINDAYKLAPWAEVLYACDDKWWRWHKGVPDFQGRKFALEPWRSEARFPDVTVLKNAGIDGLELTPGALRNGRNSGYQAINLAVQLGAVRVLLLGYDMRVAPGGKSHWFGEHPDGAPPQVQMFLPHFTTLVAPLKAAGVEVLNCSRQTALKAFPRQSLEKALAHAQAVA